MKKLFLLLLLPATLATTASAQLVMPAQKVIYGQKAKASAVKQRISGFETTPVNVNDPAVPSADAAFESLVGTTTYDLQSNSAIAKRVYNWGDGRVSGAFTISAAGEATGFPDRGTGYNITDTDGVMGAPAGGRIEGTNRTGFPAYDVLANGTEVVIAHGGSPTQPRPITKAAGATSWTVGSIPGVVGGLWPRVAAGGADGNSIHVIYVTGTSATDSRMFYCRSTNGGTSWDKVSVSLPGIGPEQFEAIGGDSYSIDANGNTVAILISDITNDLVLLKSTDNGETWTKKLVYDFPLENWNFDDGYTYDDIASAYYPGIAPDSLALFTNDETGNVFVDDQGRAHVAYAALYVLDPDTTQDGSLNWYPTYNNLGIIYWNDEMATGLNDAFIVGYSPDLNGDSIVVDAAANFFTDYGLEAFNSVPSLGMDAEGRLYISWIASHDILKNDDGIHYRNPFVTRSDPFDYTVWSEPVWVTNPDYLNDPTVAAFSEYSFPVMAEKVDDCIHMIYQRDFTLGLALRTDGNQDPEDNYIEYICVPTERFTISTKDRLVNNLPVNMVPNPAQDRTFVQFTTTNAADIQVEVFDAMGARVLAQQGFRASGDNLVEIVTTGLSNGMYYVRVIAGNEFGSAKLMIAK